MKLNNLPYLLALIFLLTSSFVIAQSCNGINFNPPAIPSSFDFNYTTTGWKNASGNPTTAPKVFGSGLNVGGSIGIFANLNYNFGIIKGHTFYVAPGASYTGKAESLKDNNVIIEGKATFVTTPNTSGTKIFVHDTGEISFGDDYAVSSNDVVHNNGIFKVGTYLAVSSNFYTYADSYTLVNGNADISGTYNSCGQLEVKGTISTQGSSNFNNLCSTFVHGDFEMRGDYTNVGLMYFKGTVRYIGPSTLYNNGTLIFDNLDLNQDDIIGIAGQSVLIARNTAKLSGGAKVTGTYFFNPTFSGFNSVCSTCTADIDIVIDTPFPTTPEEALATCGSDFSVESPTPIATLDFDGVDDYVTTTGFINGSSEVSLMAWVKSDNGNSTTMTIVGEDRGFRLYLENGNKPTLDISTNGITISSISTTAIKLNEWHHITGTFNSTTGNMKLYVDGEIKNSTTSQLNRAAIKTSIQTLGKFEIGRRSSNVSNKEYFRGDIDEVRAFKTELTAQQIQQMVYQEIEESGNNIKGAVVSKDVIDIASNKKVSWANLTAYYPMTDIISFTRIKDYSKYNRSTLLKNITTLQEQTAPMPYTTIRNGNWSQQNTWTYGNVWDIEDAASNKDWSIVKINNDVSTTDSHTNLGLIVADGKTLAVKNDNLLHNTWYLELNGTIDLNNDSQLIQGIYSDLVSSANGKIVRRQEGSSNKFHYNYWSSPVGAPSANTLGNDNSSTNNINNKNFNLGMIKDGNGSAMQFTTANDANGKISTRWTYKFQNGVTYFDWTSLNSGTGINPGMGYIHKGTGNPGNSQQYMFEGKPNNGTIKINVADTGGAGSVPGISQTSTLFGNPYASAIDLHKFIDDNVGVISGTLRLWQQWSGNSHVLSEYNGGYAEVNKLGSVRAYQFEGITGGVTGQQDGTLTATRFLPVSQGFVAEIITNGTVEFNNGQRIFVKEADANNSYNQGSVFFRTRETPDWESNAEGNIISKIRLEFNSVDGPKAKRELLMGFSSITTDEYDYGYDSKNYENKADDLLLAFKDENMTMQAYSEISATKEVALNFRASGNHSYTIKATEFENMNSDQEVYLRDELTGDYYDLWSNKEYTFNSEAGEFNQRFTIVFQSEESALTLGTEDINPLLTERNIIYDTSNDKLYIKGMTADAKSIYILSMSGQTVKTLYNVHALQMKLGIELSNISSGAYIVCVIEEGKEILNKKVIID